MNITEKHTLGSLQKPVREILEDLRQNRIISRIWTRDHTIWKEDPTEIVNRLGWLDCPWNMSAKLEEISSVVDQALRDGYTHALLLGMGGSSLAPEVFRFTFGIAERHLDLAVLDSTDPGAVLSYAHALDPMKTLYIPATKSGGTVETISFLKFFYNHILAVFPDRAGDHFVAITDPGSGLAEWAGNLQFRHTFLNDPNIGGRYSALSFFGLVAAGAIGMDLKKLLQGARDMAEVCKQEEDNPGALLGAVMAAGFRAGRDKMTLLLSPAIESFGTWIEQLVAESTGKDRQGIVPVEGEPLLSPSVYGNDRLFIHLRLAGDTTHDAGIQALAQAGHPVFRIDLDDCCDLAGEFFRWELATAVAGHCLGIQPFDQPDVEAAKVLARQMMTAYQQAGKLPESEPTVCEGSLRIYTHFPAASLQEALAPFLNCSKENHPYIALQAYIQPTPETSESLQQLRQALLMRTHLATTVGYGPRFLHSTGQLHKGDRGNGLFIQLTADPADPTKDAEIPDATGASNSSTTFGVLKAAQALGDRQALIDAGRQVLRIHLGDDILAGIEQLRQAVV